MSDSIPKSTAFRMTPEEVSSRDEFAFHFDRRPNDLQHSVLMFVRRTMEILRPRLVGVRNAGRILNEEGASVVLTLAWNLPNSTADSWQVGELAGVAQREFAKEDELQNDQWKYIQRFSMVHGLLQLTEQATWSVWQGNWYRAIPPHLTGTIWRMSATEEQSTVDALFQPVPVAAFCLLGPHPEWTAWQWREQASSIPHWKTSVCVEGETISLCLAGLLHPLVVNRDEEHYAIKCELSLRLDRDPDAVSDELFLKMWDQLLRDITQRTWHLDELPTLDTEVDPAYLKTIDEKLELLLRQTLVSVRAAASDGKADSGQEGMPDVVIPMTPRWDEADRTLYVGLHVIKTFKRRAKNQERILREFQNTGWSGEIGDPLPENNVVLVKERLRDTVRELNALHHIPNLLRFHMDGTGKGVRYEIIRAISPASP